jgi:hypothetical protein
MASQTLVMLSHTLSDFSSEAQQQKISLMNEMRREKLTVTELKNYHDKLLFLSAYADNPQVKNAAGDELSRISELVNTNRYQNSLLNSGIAFAPVQSTYTLALVKWLLKTFPGTVSFHSFDEGAPHPKDIFKYFLPQEEFELVFDDTLNPLKWLCKASGTTVPNKQIEWIVNCFESSNSSPAVQEFFFESLKVYVEINPNDLQFSRSFGKLSLKNQYYHSAPLLKKFDERKLITSSLPAEIKLTGNQRKEIISTARVALCLLQRETDPITYTEKENIKFFELERGLSIALFSMDEEQRLSLESYIGFMMFKNGYPMSYGGAWLFGKRALIGINIFEAYRGGESAVVFAQLLRTYHNAFAVEYFEVEPYQFGKKNPEGIKSGAFWFYYRFGFRPVSEELRDLSLSEHQKIVSQKGYRSSFDTLKKFTGGNLFLNLGECTTLVNPSDLSRFLTQKINQDFNGNRKCAILASNKILKEAGLFAPETKSGILKLGLFIAFCLDLKNIKTKDKELLKKLLKAKVNDEYVYVSCLNEFSFEKNLNADVKIFLSK